MSCCDGCRLSEFFKVKNRTKRKLLKSITNAGYFYMTREWSIIDLQTAIVQDIKTKYKGKEKKKM